MTFKIQCNSFSDIASSNKGTLLNINSLSTVIFSYNIIRNISSTTAPGCMSIQNNADLEMIHNSFTSCHGTGSDEHFAELLLASEAKTIIINHLAASLCAPSKTKKCDSLIRIKSITNCTSSFLNSSFCFGTSGSSSFCSSLCNILDITYMCVICSNDYASLEISPQETTKCSFSNFISCINNYLISDNSEIVLESCFFMECQFNSFFSNAGKAKCINCITDSTKSNSGFTFYSEFQSLAFDIKIQSGCLKAKEMTYECGHRIRTLQIFLLILII